ncbi:hypothetical protein GCM10010289_30990 [Streptomyces violascens]|uniref:Adenylate kinase n=1 Tax=Streptomyces violascens TaxID=67381 RepID=A0ABQ3R0F1_9ACTN|nr:hypothetical protein GCM10010289_30990 [Streptomyces violascens]GHI42998.1 hypothetical protein Sviol_74060 [Streptomyces violascens]
MRRILMAGVTRSGKSTLARAVSRRLEIPYDDMDELYFGGPRWARNSQFATRTREIAASPAWIFDSVKRRRTGSPGTKPLEAACGPCRSLPFRPAEDPALHDTEGNGEVAAHAGGPVARPFPAGTALPYDVDQGGVVAQR